MEGNACLVYNEYDQKTAHHANGVAKVSIAAIAAILTLIMFFL